MPTSIDYELQSIANELKKALNIVFYGGSYSQDQFQNLAFVDSSDFLKDDPYLRDILPHIPISEDPDYVYDVFPGKLDAGPMVGEYMIKPTFLITK